jgi:anti-sigma-K factor RskA
MGDDETIGVDERALDDDALEALAEAYATPPRRGLRARVLLQAHGEGVVRQREAALRRWRMTGAVAAGLVLVLGGLLAGERQRASTSAVELAALARSNQELVVRLEEQGRTLAGLREALAVQAHVVRVLAGPQTVTAALAPTPAGGAASGRVLVDASSGETAVVLAGLGAVPPGAVFELWAIRGERPPEPAGLLAPGAEGSVVARGSSVPRPAEVTAFAVSIEPAGGSTSPTGPIVLAGPIKS